MSVIAGSDGWPTAFTYRVGEQSLTIPLLDEEASPNLIHIKDFHPADDHYGAGCLSAAEQAIATHNAASVWNRTLLENAARPSGALVYDGGDAGGLTSEQFDRLKDELTSAFSGQVNAGRPMVLEGGLRWQPLGLSPADMDFATLKAAAARDIALAFGVPPMLLGLPGDSTYANYREANRALWRLTLLPLASKLFAALGEGLAVWFPKATLAVDLDGVPARQTVCSPAAARSAATTRDWPRGNWHRSKSPGSPSSIGGTPKASAISHAAAGLSAWRSPCRLAKAPAAASAARLPAPLAAPALTWPEKALVSSSLSRSNCSLVCPPASPPS